MDATCGIRPVHAAQHLTMTAFLIFFTTIFSLITVGAQQQLVRINTLNVQCGDSSMTVDLQFSQPFQGIIFSKGYFSQQHCVYVRPGASSTQYRFVIPYDGCGTTAGGTALTTDGRPAQFLRNLDEESNGLVAAASDAVPVVISNETLAAMINRTRRQALSEYATASNNSREALLKPLGRSFEDLGGMGGDPNAGEFISAHNMLNNGGDEQQFMPNFMGPGGGGARPNPLFSRQAAPSFNPQQNQPGFAAAPQQTQQQQFNKPAFNTNPNLQQTYVPSFQQQQPPPQQRQQPAVPVLQESIPESAQQQLQPLVIAGTQAPPIVLPTSDNVLPKGTKFMENVLIIQFDANIQEVWDIAKALRCEWHDSYHKRVTYKPMNVGALDVVEAAFAGDNIGVWMTVQQGQGPFAPEVNGIVRIGQKLTLTIGIQDPSQQFDMRVLNCIASDGNRPTIQLVDEYGCVVRPKLMAPFQKARNVGPQASVVSYATFQAFKFPDSVDVNIECSVEVCKHGCPKQCFVADEKANDAVTELASRRTGRKDETGSEVAADDSRVLNITITRDPAKINDTLTRRRRQAGEDNNVGVARKIKVLSLNDMLPFFEALRNINDSSLLIKRSLADTGSSGDALKIATSKADFCVTPVVFMGSTILLAGALVLTVLVLAFVCLQMRRTTQSKD